MQSITLKANAKINLYLAVKDKRPDGYHNIESIIQSIGLADKIKISKTIGEIVVETEAPINLTENLVYKAAFKLKDDLKISAGALIELNKTIPLVAGLGGGSADAAATMIGLNKLWDLNLPFTELKEMAAEIGADIPFCMKGGCARITGKGENIEPVVNSAELDLIIVKPDFGVSAKKAYDLYDELKPLPLPKPSALIEALSKADLKAISESLGNELEPAVFKIHPEVEKLKNSLISVGAMAALMSGSGSAVFGLVQSQNANAILEKMSQTVKMPLYVKSADTGITIMEEN